MKSGLRTLITGVLIFVIGSFVVPMLLILPLLLNESPNDRFLVPGSKDVTIDKPGRYYLWNDHKTIFQGKSYNKLEGIPDGIEILIQYEDGAKLPFTSDTSIYSSSGNSSKQSIGYVELGEPGKISVSIIGDSEERVFSFSKSNLKKIFIMIFSGGIASALSAFGGIGLIIWGIVKLARNKPSGQGEVTNSLSDY